MSKTNVKFEAVGGTPVPEDPFYPFQIGENYLIMGERRAMIGTLVAIKRGFLLIADGAFFDTDDLEKTLQTGYVKNCWRVPGVMFYQAVSIQWATQWRHKLPALIERNEETERRVTVTEQQQPEAGR